MEDDDDLAALKKRAAELIDLVTEEKTEDEQRALEEEHADICTRIEAVRAHVTGAAREAEAPTTSHVRVEVGTEHAEKRAALIESALLHRADPARFELSEGGREYRGMGLLEIARDTLEARGVHTRGMSKLEVASAALEQRSGGMHSTSDFTVILGNVVNRTLRASYEAAPQTFRPLVREVNASDFKAMTRGQLGEAPAFEKVNEHGEFKRGSVGEGKETYSIATYGKIVGITRQVLVNDDLGAFTRLPQMFGVQAANLESDLVWFQILSNPAMGDGTALFHSSHKNLGSAAALDIAPISKGRAAMSKQVGLDGKTVLNIRPSYLIVPVDLETTAEQKLRTAFYPDTSDKAATGALRSLQIISEPRLDNGINSTVGTVSGSSTAYYLAASPSQIDTVELAYLEGQRGVYTESRMGFDVDGVEFKVRMDVGAKVIDWRGFHKNAGS